MLFLPGSFQCVLSCSFHRMSNQLPTHLLMNENKSVGGKIFELLGAMEGANLMTTLAINSVGCPLP